MQEASDVALAKMGELNNAIIAMIDGSECSPIEVISVLRMIAFRLEKAFELSVMGNPVSRLVEEVKDGSDVEETRL